MLAPSKTSSSCPPTRFTYAKKTSLSAARVASILSLKPRLPAWKGDPLMLTITSAPAASLGHGRADGVPDVLADVNADRRAVYHVHLGGLARSKVTVFVEHAVVRQELLVVHVHQGDRRMPGPRRCRPPSRARPRIPRPTAIPSDAAATRSTHRRFSSRNWGFRRRSSGGYPGTASSGNAIRSTCDRRAWAMQSRIRAVLPCRSPTVTLIWASAILRVRINCPGLPRYSGALDEALDAVERLFDVLSGVGERKPHESVAVLAERLTRQAGYSGLVEEVVGRTAGCSFRYLRCLETRRRRPWARGTGCP